jgi:hypothetical protein
VGFVRPKWATRLANRPKCTSHSLCSRVWAARFFEISAPDAFQEHFFNGLLKQANVMTKEGKPVEFAVDYGINLCRDGSPPTEGMDLEQIGKALGRR